MISIIIPVYNQGQKLIRALAAINRQSYQDYEVIIVNDGSHDQVEMIFAHYYQTLSGSQKYLFINQSNQGAPAARNRGFKEARGDYLFFHDADAVLNDDALEKLRQALVDNPEASYAYPSFYWGRKLFKVGPFDPEKLRLGPYIHTMALIKRSDFPQTGWDEQIQKFQDWDLWLTMLEGNHRGIWIPEVLFKVSPGGTISFWMPASFYKLLPFLPVVKKYQAAKKIIKTKHGLYTKTQKASD